MLLASLKEIPRTQSRDLHTRRQLPARPTAGIRSASECHRNRRPTEWMSFLSLKPESRMPTHRRPPWRERPGLFLSRSPETHRTTNACSSAFILATVAVSLPKLGLHSRPCAATLLPCFLRTLLLLSSVRACLHHTWPAWHAVGCAYAFWRRERRLDGLHSHTLRRLI